MRTNIPEADKLINKYFPVSNFGHVALTDYMGGDLSVERFARGSYEINPKKRTLRETKGILRFLKRHNHTSPFECTELSFHLAMPIFVSRQWIRHRTADVNETSARYTEIPTLFYDPERSELRVQGGVGSNKQCSGETTSDEVFETFIDRHIQTSEDCKRAYHESLERRGLKGISPN